MRFLPQDLIHRFELATGHRYFRRILVLLALAAVALVYNSRAFRNMSTQEAMDSAQLARNLAEGRGYTTRFIRPFSTYLVKKRSIEKHGQPAPGKPVDLALVRTNHPDIANAPVYPVLLAGLMKVLPFRYTLDTSHPFWSVPKTRFSEQDKSSRQFWRYQPDFLISFFNQVLLFGAVLGVFFLARRLFDEAVAWVSAAAVLGNELLWRFCVSGQSTMLLVLIYLALAWCLVLLERELRDPDWGPRVALILAGLAGLLTGVGGLTRYAFGWLIIPVAVFLALFAGPRRTTLVLVAVAAFTLVMTPWIVRNYSVSGTPFGTAGYAVLEGSAGFAENHLERSLNPDLNHISLPSLWAKLLVNLRTLVQTDLPRLGGNWTSAFFLVGLLVTFRSPALGRLRYFLLMSVAVLGLAQALGRTHLSEDSPEINTENLLVLVGPLVVIYGVSLFFLLLDQIPFPIIQLRYLAIGVFSVVLCLPMIFGFLPPKTIPIAYPPYYPPAIQGISGWVKDRELTMSDIPWAMAWYGDRQSMWLTLNAQSEFFAVNDFMKPVVMLYLTPATMDKRFLSQWIRAGEQSWGSFILESTQRKEVPPSFPLRKSQAGWLPEQLVLTDWERWRKAP
jgi:hypothetical protein